ncbi:MAG: TfuA domain-containing protein [Stenomitos rutilans HA7619-LM2]|jgi:hypothetical protein|nr:TfuA domain-containing protein [Stenomitos rutilans HA7619-LM2]
MAEIIAFAGPSLPAIPDSTWNLLLNQVQLQPPAQEGDILAVIDERPHTLVLIDGYYFDGRDHIVAAVKPQELITAVNAGIRLIGAASIGAIYAAELSQYGVVGVGQVFEWFRNGILRGTDELIILHLPEEFGYQHITVALVEVRYALQQLVNEQFVSAAASQAFIATVKELPFPERSLDVILQLARSYLNESTIKALQLRLTSNSVKQADTKLGLQFALFES